MTVRLGLHRMSGRADDAFRDYVERVRPNVVKFLDPGPGDESLAAWCRSLGTEVIGRIYFDPQELGAGGRRQIGRVLEAARACPSIRYWELHNEAWQSDEQMRRYAELSIDFMQQIDALGGGRKAVIGCFSVGMPDLRTEDPGIQWRNFAPALRYAAEHGHALGLHQYGGGSQGMRFDPLWYALRHRQVVAWAKAAGVPMPRILITESGIDKLDEADRETRGWTTMPNGYDYAADMAWFCSELSKDHAVIGVVDFGFAHLAGTEWGPYDLADRPDVLYRVAALQAAIPDTAPPKPIPGGTTMDLGAMLAAEFGGLYSDLRASLPRHPNGPAGDFSPRALGNIDILAVHHTAGPKGQTWAQVAQEHITGRGWAGIGYHIGIRGGSVSYIGDVSLARACCLDQNHRVLCVVLTGNYEEETVDKADAEALRRVVAVCQRWAAGTTRRTLAVKGHREVPGQATACPGRNLLPLVHELATGKVPAPGPVPPPVVAKPNMVKVTWFLEDVQRRMEREGLAAESRFVGTTYTADAIRRRDTR